MIPPAPLCAENRDFLNPSEKEYKKPHLKSSSFYATQSLFFEYFPYFSDNLKNTERSTLYSRFYIWIHAVSPALFQTCVQKLSSA